MTDPIGMPTSNFTYKDKPTPYDELKHSVHLHLMIMNGPTQQLSVFLVKLFDLMPQAEGYDESKAGDATMSLAYHIVESIGVHVQQTIKRRADQAAQSGRKFPDSVIDKSFDILTTIHKTNQRAHDPKSKLVVLRAISTALSALSTVTNSKYFTITTARGDRL